LSEASGDNLVGGTHAQMPLSHT